MYYTRNGCGPWQDGPGGFGSRVPVDIIETEDAYNVHLYAPALKKESFVITTREDVLSVSYREEEAREHGAFIRREYRPVVDRSFDLKGKVVANEITAQYEDGVLKLVLPKSSAARTPQAAVAVE